MVSGNDAKLGVASYSNPDTDTESESFVLRLKKLMSAVAMSFYGKFYRKWDMKRGKMLLLLLGLRHIMPKWYDKQLANPATKDKPLPPNV